VELVQPVIGPGATPVGVVTGQEAPFEAVAYVDGVEIDGGDVQWQWDFGDGSDLDMANPTTHTYTTDGVYSATVTATYGGAQSTLDFTVVAGPDATGMSVWLTEPAESTDLDPIMDGPYPVSAVTGQATAFEAAAYLNGLELNSADVQWEWDFGDGSSSDTANPTTHTYAADETYSATVTATYGGEQAVFEFTVIAGAAPSGLTVQITGPADGFSADVGNYTTFTAVAYQDGVALDATTVQWQWDFGDGCQSTDNPADHIFAQCGDYVVRVAATVGQSTATKTISGTVTYVAGLTVAIVEPSPSKYPPPVNQATTFHATAYMDGVALDDATVQWLWDFGDQTASSTDNPVSHTYATAGDYVVVVTATVGQSTATATLPVTSAGGTGGQGGSEPPWTVTPGCFSRSRTVRCMAAKCATWVTLA